VFLRAVAMEREHHFYVSIAKFLFHHNIHGVVITEDPISIQEAKKYDLEPIILYGLTFAGYSLRWLTFSSLDKPKAFLQVLLDAWTNAEGLRGYPDVLRVNRHIVESSPELIENMENMGIELKIAEGNDRYFPTSLRTAQKACKWLLGKYGEPIESIEELCVCAKYDHDFHAKNVVRENLGTLFDLPFRKPNVINTENIDWIPGAWLSNWESALPPEPLRFLTIDGMLGRVSLYTGEPEEELSEDEIFYSGYDNRPEIIKDLIACFPNKPIEIAKHIGTTLKELNWYTTEKSDIERPFLYNLCELFGIEYDERRNEYVGCGPYVLIAKKQSALERIYNMITEGGNAQPYEVIPRLSEADPSWRYIIINPYGAPPCILMSPRGARINERLPDLLLNYAGTVTVGKNFYINVVSTCARACIEPKANITEASVFANRCKPHWNDYFWRPESDI
jgi:hypothetical protein